MLSLPNEIADVLAPFRGMFAQQRSWQKAQTLLVGAILCQGHRTVSRVLQVMGLGQAPQYGKYDRMLSRVGWSGLAAAQTLLSLIILAFVGPETVVIGIDETLERRWLNRYWVCVGDGSYGNAKFGWVCRRHGVALVARLNWKAKLYDFAPTMPPRYPGRPRTKGVRLPSMQHHLEHLKFESGTFHRLHWYGGRHALRQWVTGTAVWDVDGYPPLPLRWVLVIDPTGAPPPALFSTSLLLSPPQMVELYVARWSLEVTFEEARAHLGVFTRLKAENRCIVTTASMSWNQVHCAGRRRGR